MTSGIYSVVPGTDKAASRIVMGTAVPPCLYGKACNERFDAAFSLGITTFDTARNYAYAENSLGLWLKANAALRENTVIISKCAHPDEHGKRVNERAIREDFAKSQEALSTDYIDVYMLHRDDTDVPVGEIVEIFNALLREGKIKSYGASNWTTGRLREANAYAAEHGLVPFAASSPNFSLAYQKQDPWGGGCVSITGEENRHQRDYYRDTQMPVFAYSSLGRGMFSGRFAANDRDGAKSVLDAVALKAYDCDSNYERLARCEELAALYGVTVAQIALKWIFMRGMNMFAIIGTLNEERIAENIAALSVPLTEKQADYLNLEF